MTSCRKRRERTQNCINLPHERVPDLKATLANGNAILNTSKLVGRQTVEGADSATDLEIVGDISEAWLVVDPPSAGTRLRGEPTTQKRFSVVFGAPVGRFGGRVGRRRLRVVRHG